MTATASEPTSLFTFNGNYKDLEQVAAYYDDFLTVFEQVKRPGADFAYNDDFVGKIPAIANTEQRGSNSGTHEETAIYLLQSLRRQRQIDAREAELLAAGYEHLDQLDATTTFKQVVLIPEYVAMQGPYAELTGARVIPCEHTGAPSTILPRRHRVNGLLVNGRKVMVLR